MFLFEVERMGCMYIYLYINKAGDRLQNDKKLAVFAHFQVPIAVVEYL